MSKSRRDFLTLTSLGVLGAAAARIDAQDLSKLPPGAPPAFGAGPAVGPEVSVTTFAEAEKLVQFPLKEDERAMAASSWRRTLASLYERRTGPRKLALDAPLSPATRWDPMLPGIPQVATHDKFIRSESTAAPLPAKDEDIAFATVVQLSRWIEKRQLTSERLTRIYLDRLERFNPQLRCAITITAEHALHQAKQADAEIANHKYRGPLHGIPYGVKDLLDTAGIPTTYGAEPYRNRVPAEDSVVV